MTEDRELKKTFDYAAELYQLARPHYPEELFNTLVEKVELLPYSRLLEIGPGTGQATKPLAERGYAITAIELGKELASVAWRELKQYPQVEIIIGAFEDVELPTNSFDLVYSATAFHWIDSSIRYAKPHSLLKENGCLAIIHTNHVSDENGDNFYNTSQPIYRKYSEERPKSSSDKKKTLVKATDLKPEPLDESFFNLVHFETFPIALTYTASEYTNLISTYSPTLSMSPERRKEFLTEIAELINTQFGGSVSKSYAMTLTVAKRK